MRTKLYWLISIFALVLLGSLIHPGFSHAQTICTNVPPNGAPRLNVWPIQETGADCTDYPLLAMKNLSTGGNYVTGGTVNASNGDRLQVRLYVHNGVLDYPENIAYNVQLAAFIPQSTSGGTITATAWANNHGTIYSSQKGGDVSFHLANSNQFLSYVSGTAKVYGRGPVLLGSFPDSVTGSGASVGDMHGCYNFLRFVTFEIEVKENSEPAGVGTIYVNSNVPTSWVISGGNTLSGSGTSAHYFDVLVSPPDYIISVPQLSGYLPPVVTPSLSQTLRAGSYIQFNINYSTQPPVQEKGNLIVNCNDPPAGAWTISNVGHRNGPDSFDTLNPGVYNITFDAFSGWNTPAARNATVYVNQNTLVTCNYTQDTLNAPTITSVDNSDCGKMTVNWADNSNNESYFTVWRSTSQWTGFAQVSGQLPANTTSFTDTPPPNQSYYYMVRAHKTSPVYLQRDSAPYGPTMPRLCSADLSGSSKNLISVTNSAGLTLPYASNLVMVSGDTVSFRITLVNHGTASAHIDKIVDIPSANVGNIRNARINKGSGFHTLPTNGNTFNVNDTKPTGNPNWIIEYDMTLLATTTDSYEQMTNKAVIYFTDPIGSRTYEVNFGPVLFKHGGGKPPQIREIAP
ncbi:MAG: hypothetical protein ACM3KM_00880 [Acidobacteriaceae bacterium]